MAILENVLPTFDYIIPALHAVRYDEAESQDLFKNRLIREEQGFSMRKAPSGENDLFVPRPVKEDIKPRDKCPCCGRNGHKEKKCRQKDTSLPRKRFQHFKDLRKKQQTTFANSQENDLDESGTIGLFYDNIVSCEQKITCCPSAISMDIAFD